MCERLPESTRNTSKKNVNRRAQRGASLLEVMIYVGLAAAAAGLLYQGHRALQEDMRATRTAQQFAAFQQSIANYQRDGRGTIPADFYEIDEYLPQVPVHSNTEAGENPWGDPFELRMVGTEANFVTHVKNEARANRIARNYGPAAVVQPHSGGGHEVLVPVGDFKFLETLLEERSLATSGPATDSAMEAPLGFGDSAVVVINTSCEDVVRGVAVDALGRLMSCKLRCGDRVWRPAYENSIAMKNCGGGIQVCEHQPCPTMKTCWDGTVIPVADPCPASQTCLDGTVIAAGDTCMKTCGDGSQVPETADCLCQDGVTIMPADGICLCPDNTIMPANGVCGGGPTKTCLDGTVVPIADPCMKTCQNGTQVLETADCFCTNGLIEPLNGPCDIACPSTATTTSVPYNQVCICASNNLAVANGECPLDCDPATETWDPVNGCECNAGLVEDSSGNCVLPINLCNGPNEILQSGNVCACVAGFEDVDPDPVDADCRAQCLPGEHRDPVTLACVTTPTCGPGQTYDIATSSCVCNPPNVLHPTNPLACLPPCPAGQSYDLTLTCVCPGNQIYNTGLSQCECPTTMPNWDPVTQLCSASISCTDPNEVVNASPPPNCVCQSGFYRDSYGDCVTTCPADQYYDINQLACVCIMTDSAPDPVLGCPAVTLCTPGLNEMQDPNDPRVCICQAGYERDSQGYCCLDDMHFSSTYLDCVCDATNQPADPVLGCSGTSCVPGLNEVPCSGDASQCCCASGFVRDSQGVCCPPGEEYDAVAGACQVPPVCVAGINEIAGVADPSNPPSCVCDPAWERNYAGLCVLAACNDLNERRCPGDVTRCCCDLGYSRDSNGVCVSICAVGQHYDSGAGACVCDTTLAAPVLGSCPACLAGTNEQAGVPDLADFVAPLRCECLSGYVRDGAGVCQYSPTVCTPGPNEMVDPNDSTQCICIAGYERCDGDCIAECPSGQARNPADCSCVTPPPNCTAGLNEQAGVPDLSYPPACVCDDGHTRTNGVCCPNGTEYDTVDGRCECVPGPNQAQSSLDPELCVCDAGFVDDGFGYCCPPGSMYDLTDARCECVPGFNERQNPSDAEQCICLSGYVRDSNGYCCPSGEVYNSATLSCEIPTCTAGLNEQAGVNDPYVSGACMCLAYHTRSNGVCCPNGTDYDTVDGRCECVPGFNEAQSGVDPELCICTPGNVRDAQGYCCPSGTAYDLVDLRCECTPGTNERQNPADPSQCICVAGYVRDSNGYCCPPGETYDPATQQCGPPPPPPPQCTQGINEIAGVDDPSVPGACACISNYVRDSNGICCPSGEQYDSVRGQCRPPPPPQCTAGINEDAGVDDPHVRGACACILDYERDSNGVCCPAGEEYDPIDGQCKPPACVAVFPMEPCDHDETQCCCVAGYTLDLTFNVCCPDGWDVCQGGCYEPCDEGETRDSNTCICGPGEGTSPILSCAPGDFGVLSGNPYCEPGSDPNCYFEGSYGTIELSPDLIPSLNSDCTWEGGAPPDDDGYLEGAIGELCAAGNGPWQCDIEDDRYGGCAWGWIYVFLEDTCRPNCGNGTYDTLTGNCEYCEPGRMYDLDDQLCIFP